MKAAGVTTGSFYWYYKSKEELFDALVGAHYDHIMQMYQDSLDAFWELSKGEQKEHIIVSGIFAGLFELVSHNIPVDTARVCARQLHDFYAAGWSYLLNVPESEKMTKNSVDR